MTCVTRSFLFSCRVQDYGSIGDDDAHAKKRLCQKLGALLWRGIPCKQHHPEADHAYSIILRLQSSSTKHLVWEGGEALNFTEGRSIDLGRQVELVSAGMGAGGFSGCRSAVYANESACVSLCLYRDLLLLQTTGRSLDLEFDTKAEAEAVAYALSLVVSDGYALKVHHANSSSSAYGYGVSWLAAPFAGLI